MVVVNEMKKTGLFLFAVIAMVVGVSSALVHLKPHERRLSGFPLPSVTPSAQQPDLIDYKVGRVIRSSNAPHEVTVIISLEPRRFVRNEVLSLAKQLNKEFADVQILRVEILDDPNIAENYVPAGDMYQLFNDAKRGTYVLNRNTRKERIEFSFVRGMPMDKVTIDSTEPNKSQL